MNDTGKSVIYVNQQFPHRVEEVFAAFSKAVALRAWWGPPNIEVISVDCDFRESGSYSVAMRKNDGHLFYIKGAYHEIVVNRKIVFSFYYEGLPTTVGETMVYIDFVDLGDSTELRLRQEFLHRPPDMEGRNKGWKHMLSSLAGFLAQHAGNR